ncbi:hypothetical protein GCM10022393_17730 [Aquimarina addita]|uniref:DUF547 domain-containing protein n=1 Tax=Aquimarina addita TaxID=870485 RepID=A0ABP6UJ91_9FLAO
MTIRIIISFLYLFISLGCISEPKQDKTENDILKNTNNQVTKTKDAVFKDTMINLNVSNQVTKIKDTIIVKSQTLNKPTKITTATSKSNYTKNNNIKNDSIALKISLPNHNIWDQLTKKHVSPSGNVSYTGFISDIDILNSYLLHLQNIFPQKNWSKNEKLAYWFNLYNASTIQLIATSYPVKSIKDIHGGKPWDKKFIKSGSNLYSLNDIENTIVRSNYSEPRLHVAFNCGAISCPKLLNGAFLPANLNTQLQLLSKNWINDLSKNKIAINELQISKIFEWYKDDFKNGIIPFINRYTDIEIQQDAIIIFLDYNWNLNE